MAQFEWKPGNNQSLNSEPTQGKDCAQTISKNLFKAAHCDTNELTVWCWKRKELLCHAWTNPVLHCSFWFYTSFPASLLLFFYATPSVLLGEACGAGGQSRASHMQSNLSNLSYPVNLPLWNRCYLHAFLFVCGGADPTVLRAPSWQAPYQVDYPAFFIF